MGLVVSALFFYPVKSCRGIALDRATLEPRGFRHDRRWMLVNAVGRFVTQRTHAQLARVEVALDAGVVTLRAPGLTVDALELPVEPAPGAARMRVGIWADEVDAVDLGDEAGRWASALLGEPARIVFMPDDVRRPVKPKYARPDDVVGFADAFPVLLASTSSLDDLNAHMAPGPPLPMDRFRPNIVVTGAEPWAEDRWRRVRIGSIPLRVPKPCDRCVITTTDQRTGERGVEPLRTLATFRREGNDVFFAVNGIPDATGEVAIGDPVTVLE